MSEIAASQPGQSTVLDNVRALLPEIQARAEEIEQARAVPRDLAEKLRSAGVFRRYVPRTHGGDEMWPDEGLTASRRDSIIEQTPLRRTGSPEDIARAVLFFASDAPFVTGQILAVDGGRSIGW